METFVTVIMILATIALGALAIQLFSTSRDDRMATLASGRSRRAGKGPGRVAAARTGTGGLWRMRPWRRTRK